MQTDGNSCSVDVDPTWRIAIVYSSFYEEEMKEMVIHTKDALLAHGIKEDGISFCAVAGSFEIPLIGAALAKAKKADALIALGIIVEGETEHARLIATEAARGCMDVQIQYGIPFAFEVLQVPTLAIAKKRLSKGKEAANAILHSLANLRSL